MSSQGFRDNEDTTVPMIRISAIVGAVEEFKDIHLLERATTNILIVKNVILLIRFILDLCSLICGDVV